MNPQPNAPLAPYTSLAVGGPAERLYIYSEAAAFESILAHSQDQPISILGYGANVLISDKGLPGMVVLLRGGNIQALEDTLTIVADAGVWWDDLVQSTIAANLWGMELMSAIPGLGAAIVGNIAAYGQAVTDTLQWVEVFDRASGKVRKLDADKLGLSYRYSSFQTPGFENLVILRAAFELSPQPTSDVTYQSAVDIATEKGFDLATLAGRRDTILETRARAGSLWDFRKSGEYMHTAGSFFRNPTVDEATAAKLMAFDETGKTAEMIQKMNQVHGGNSLRVSAAHVLLAAGFQRGQTWGPVRLHPDHILKIENTGGATAQQIYDVATEIVRTVKEKLDVDLIPEVRFLGTFE